jgi:acetyltransferase-like isoleucine patch superfamily enzyme
MATAVQLRRGTAAEHTSFTGLEGEVTVDTTNDTLRVHDGSTAGGFRLAKFSEVLTANNIESHLIPATANTYDLGTAAKPWRTLYVSSNTIVVGSVNLSTANGTLFVGPNAVLTGTVAGDSTTISGNTYLTNLTVSGNTSITNLVLTNVLDIAYGGTGRSSLVQNGVMIGANSSVMGFVTGTTGQVMQIAANGTPTFDKLDGGSF